MPRYPVSPAPWTPSLYQVSYFSISIVYSITALVTLSSNRQEGSNLSISIIYNIIVSICLVSLQTYMVIENMLFLLFCEDLKLRF
jgi:hypothetical protein